MRGRAKIQPKRWRYFYRAALRARGDSSLRQLKVSVAVTACVRRLLEISPEGSLEREQISVALRDLKILRDLYRKYG